MQLVNISIDDISPNPSASTKCIQECLRILEKFPTCKFSLFMSTAYWRTMPPSISMSERPYFINEYPEFLEELRLLDRSSFELCYHGMYHGIPGVSNNDELRDISFADACMLFSQMINDAESVCHLPMKRIIRPPAWRMSPGAIMAARICGFKILALSDDLYALETYQGKHLEKDDVVFYTCAPPLRPLQLSQTTEIVYHALEHDQNYLSSQKTDELLLFLKQNIDSINFCFLNEMK